MIDFADQSVEQAIFLLRRLLDKSPADTRNRLRLLSLLNGRGDKEAFLLQVSEWSENYGPVDAEAWQQVCEMGRGLDPDNDLFTGELMGAAKGDHGMAGLESDGGSSVVHTEERRSGEDRRKDDRRETVSTWTGKERRYWRNRRESVRRDVDAKERQQGPADDD